MAKFDLKTYSQRDVMKHIQTRHFSNIYILYGSDIALVTETVNKLRDAVIPPDDMNRDFNLHEFIYRDTDFEEFESACFASPMFSDRACVTISAVEVTGQYKINTEKSEIFYSVMESVPDETVLIVYYNAFDMMDTWGRLLPEYQSFFSKLSKMAGNRICICDISTSAQELSDEIRDTFSMHGGSIGKDEAAYLVTYCGGDHLLIRNETQKLIAFADGRPVTKEIIGQICIQEESARIDEMTNAVLRRDAVSAIRFLNIIHENSNDDSIMILLIYSLQNVFNDAYRLSAAASDNKNYNNVGEDFGYGSRTYGLSRLSKTLYSERTDIRHIRKCIVLLTECEMKMKRTHPSLHRMVLEQTIVEMLRSE